VKNLNYWGANLEIKAKTDYIEIKCNENKNQLDFTLNGEKIDYPNPQTVMNKGDKLLLIGNDDDFQAFDYLAKEKVILPKDGDSCLWLSICKNSDFVGKKLSEINLQEHFGVIIQGIRRKNRYIRFPDIHTEIKLGDNILLFGKLELLNQVNQ